jgi:hypothetical protein
VQTASRQAAPPPYPSPIGRGVNTVIPLLLDKWWYANNILVLGKQKLDNIFVREEQKLDNILVGGYKFEVPSL